jgi:Zn-dependent metalloprotease
LTPSATAQSAASRSSSVTGKASSGAPSIHSTLGLTSSELQAARSQTYANGRVVTRFQQFHQGVPVGVRPLWSTPMLAQRNRPCQAI